eukprot:Ihof_evm1s495 gene=Ihof_evmTU1s495
MGEDSDTENELVMADIEEGYTDSEQDEETNEKRRDHIDHMAKIEQEFADLKDRLYQEKVAALDVEMQMLSDGVHEGYLQQVADLESQKDQHLATAELFPKYQLECIAAHCNFEKRLAEHEYMVAKHDLRSKMLTALEERKRRLQLERSHNELIEAELGDISSQSRSNKHRGSRRKERTEEREAKRRATPV